MNRLAAFGRFWCDFVVGDDWVAATGIVVAIGATAGLAASHVAAWWEGMLDEFERRTDYPARTYVDPVYGEITCPPLKQEIARTLRPEKIDGTLRTASAAREGVTIGIGLPSIVEAETGSEGEPCVRPDGGVIYEPRLSRGGASPVAVDNSLDGRLPLPAAVRFRASGRFGHAFTIAAVQTVKEPTTGGTWVSAMRVKLTFQPCPRRGRDVTRC